ncbi:MAG: Crp/Fnr family transcriptional regulator [Hyphomicrobiaceae bacterium]|nr:Crp/Fnr family transcriptional regulator [Hyphomicrobiaceae bacterium]
MTQPQQRDWISAFPGLAGLSDDIRKVLVEQSLIVELPAGSRIFGLGQAPQNFLLLLKGSIRVQQVSENGREIVLYRVSAGESCALTTACLLGYEDYLAEGIAETDVRGVAIPRATFDTLIAHSPEFRQFVFRVFSNRVTNLFRLIDEVAFQRLDIRLAQRILELAGDQPRLEITHQELASELGTAREVISRQLNEFQRRGWISSGRGYLDVIAPDALRNLAAM